MALNCKGGGITMNALVLEVPPSGFTTVSVSVPTVDSSAVVSVVVNWVAETNVAAWLVPLTVTAAPLTKFVPVMVTTVSPLTAYTLFGDRLAMVGAGEVTGVRATGGEVLGLKLVSPG